MAPLRILVYGAGVLGSLYAARLQQSGNEVTVLARGQRLEDIRSDGVVLEDASTGASSATRVDVTEELSPADAYDLVLVPVRREQLPTVLPSLAASHATPNVVLFGNNAGGPDVLTEALGPDRVLLGFPGASGALRGSTVRYFLIRQQPTTLGELDGARSPRLASIADSLRAAGFSVAISGNMDGWLKTHAVFVTAMSAALYLAQGDPRRLTLMTDTLDLMVRATKEGYRSLSALGSFDAPRNLRVLYGWMPTWFAVRYWRRSLPTEVGELGFAAHANAAREEMTLLAEEVRRLVRTSAVPARSLEELYLRAGMAA
jgi:2-dehydropantoate 2-reductase